MYKKKKPKTWILPCAREEGGEVTDAPLMGERECNGDSGPDESEQLTASGSDTDYNTATIHTPPRKTVMLPLRDSDVEVKKKKPYYITQW